MSNDKNKVTVQIVGQRYTLRAGDDPDYVTGLAGFVDEKMRTLMEVSRSLQIQDAAILTAINIADELMRLRSELEELKNRPDVSVPETEPDEEMERIGDRLAKILKRMPETPES